MSTSSMTARVGTVETERSNGVAPGSSTSVQSANSADCTRLNVGSVEATATSHERGFFSGRPLTDKQRSILSFIDVVSRRGSPPTIREIGTQFGIRSTNGVNDHLLALERKGCIGRRDMKSRSIWITVVGRRELAGTNVSLHCAVCGRGP